MQRNWKWKFQLQKSLKYFSILWPMKNDVKFVYVQRKNIWFCFIPIVWVHFSHKIEKCWFWKSLKYFNVLIKNIWCQVWLCPVKQCLIWFKLRCLSRILLISWKIRILNFKFENSLISFNWGICCQIKICTAFFCLIWIFWQYYRNSFELKKFLLILRYIEIL